MILTLSHKRENPKDIEKKLNLRKSLEHGQRLEILQWIAKAKNFLGMEA
jgi:hypothetical protein